MKLAAVFATALLALHSFLHSQDTPVATETFDPKSLDALKPKLGQVIAVEGTVVRSGESKSGTRRYLNFTQNFNESVSLVFIVAKAPADFTKEKADAWVGKKVRATGTLSEYEGRLQLTIEKPDQLVEVP